MKNLLVVNSSPNLDTSISRKLSAEFIEKWEASFPEGVVKTRDLVKDLVPHLTQETIGAFYALDADKTAAQKLAVALSDTLVDEVLAADTIVIGAPMHNFSISSGLKAYFDHIARVGRTFNYTENGPVGELSQKKIHVIVASGGKYSKGNPAEAMNMVEPVITTFLNFLGVRDINFIYAEGVAMGEDVVGETIKAAEVKISQIITDVAA